MKSLVDATDAGFVFAVKYLLPVPEISGQLHHHVLLRNAHLFSKDRALYLLSSAPAVLTSLECFVAQKDSREFLVQLKKWQDDLLATEFLDLLLDELEDEASDNQKLERLFHQVSTFYSVAVAEELFWTYGYATSGFTRPASGN
ncbi:hypothetical protein [Bdellovibrio bacteriovorus]|uniref:hypothetical protein n=1 Tax=Bdellovibrio bacteriovorus TaxID=959 RepID=UPI0035A6A9D4